MEMVVIYTRDKNGIWEKIQKGLYRLLVENPKFAHLDTSYLEMAKEIPEDNFECPEVIEVRENREMINIEDYM